jgi:hypothetical protein
MMNSKRRHGLLLLRRFGYAAFANYWRRIIGNDVVSGDQAMCSPDLPPPALTFTEILRQIAQRPSWYVEVSEEDMRRPTAPMRQSR